MNEKQFYYWQGKLRNAASKSLPITAQQSQFVPFSIPVYQPTRNHKFIPTIVIRVGSISIELSEQVHAEILSSVLKVLTDAQ